MGQKLEKMQTLPLADLGAASSYSRETDRLLEEALAEYADMKRRGYGREDGFAEFEAVQRELTERSEG